MTPIHWLDETMMFTKFTFGNPQIARTQHKLINNYFWTFRQQLLQKKRYLPPLQYSFLGCYGAANEQNCKFNLQLVQENICEEDQFEASHDASQRRETLEV